jgi:WhiB family redox-sensing transcriptional regulator
MIKSFLSTQFPGSWVNRAACARPGIDPDIFFPNKGDGRGGPRTAEAKSICRACPVVAECLEFALDCPDLRGIWGGVGYNRRQEIRRERAQGAN